jgi:signal transduction histidine kinase
MRGWAYGPIIMGHRHLERPRAPARPWRGSPTAALPAGLRRALVTVAVCVAALATLQLAMALDNAGRGTSAAVAAVPTLAGLLYAGAGVIAWARRPHNRTGMLLAAAGLAWIGWGLRASGVPVLAALGLLCEPLPFAIVVHLLLAFPSGRLEGTAERVVVAVNYLVVALVHAPCELLGASRNDGITVLDVVDDATVGNVALAIQTATDGIVLAAAAGLVIRRARTQDPSWRRLAAPVYAGGIATLTVVALLDALDGTGFTANGGWPVQVLDGLSIAIVMVLPLGFLTAMLRGGFAPAGELQELVLRLGRAPPGPEGLAAAVADALGDRSAAVAYWLEDERRYVDGSGAPLWLDAGRGVEEVIHDDRRVGAIVYDRVLLRGAEPVRSVARVAGLALEHERLAARLRAGARELRASRARLAEAADAERRRIARDLHDGAQQRLVLLAIESERLARAADDPRAVRRAAAALRAGLDAALTDVRHMVQGMVPPLLAERGLRAAAEELAAQAPIPVALEADDGEVQSSEHVQSTAYFVISEALANVAKHSRATRATVSLRRGDGSLRIEVVDDGVGGADRARGSGIDGLADRVGAAGGRLDVESPPGAGTRLYAELPCES